MALFAYTLEDGAALSRESTVTGVILAIPSAYSADYGNITVNIGVPGLFEQPIQCYRLTGGEDLAEGDIITVTGTIKNYKGTIEFDKGCTYVKGAPATEDEELAKAVEELQALLDSEGIDLDVEALLAELMALFDEEEGGEEIAVEDNDADLEQLFAELAQLFEGIADETKTGEDETPAAESEGPSDEELEALFNELFSLIIKE